MCLSYYRSSSVDVGRNFRILLGTSFKYTENSVSVVDTILSLHFLRSNMTGPDPSQNGAAAAHAPQGRQFGTLAVHAGAPHDPTTGAVIAPVSTVFAILQCR